jgi:CelD/BcsL family acetyltransferase involved in cellulose biosynthesis
MAWGNMNCQQGRMMHYSISRETLETIVKAYPGEDDLKWPSVFVLPGWLKAWWRSFGAGYEQLILAAWEDGHIIGIAPFKFKDGVASFTGDNSVCDYLDFIIVPGKENIFSRVLLDGIRGYGVNSMILETLRPDSAAINNIVNEAGSLGYRVDSSRIDSSFEMSLPDTWEEYIASLESRQRRDVDRKIRQLENMAEVRYIVLRNAEIGDAELDLFFRMMTDSRGDKARFLTDEMRGYFRNVAAAMSDYGLLRLAFLNVGVARVAGILYFEYNNRIYLYNSGYMPQFADMNVGLVSKLYCIRQSILEKKKVFDFLKGPEIYKARLGGQEVNLSRCIVDLK